MDGSGFGSTPEPERRRRLDEIFADEPFLSPTMRARQITDLMPGKPSPEVLLNPRSPEAIKAVADQLMPPAPPPAGTISLAEARRSLRTLSLSPSAPGSAAGTGDGGRVHRLRDDVLVPWLFEMRKAGWRG